MRFFPRLYKELIQNSLQNGIQIISARSMFDKEYPSKILFLIIIVNILDGFKEWKNKTFLKLAEMMDKDKVTNIVAIGDS